MGFFEKLKNGLKKTKEVLMKPVNSLFSSYDKVDDEFFEELFDILVMSDVGVATSQEIIDGLKERLKEKKIKETGAAREELIRANLRLVLSVIQRFANRKESVDDLFQIGCIGLIKAMDNFDLSQNVRFSTYAVPMIMGEIRRYLRDNNAIRVSRSLRDTAYKVLQKRNELCAERGEDVPIEDIARAMEMPVEEVVFALEAIQDPVSLFEPVYHDGNDAVFVMDQMSDEKNKQENWLETIALSQALQRLAEREQNIIYLRYFKGRTQMEVAEEIGISQAQVSRLEKCALHRLKTQM